MTLNTPAAISEAFDDVRTIAQCFNEPWWLIGSAGAHIAGADVGPVKDIDLLVSAQDADALCDQWREFLLPAAAAHPQFRSNPFYRFQRALVVETMANFEIRIDGVWTPIVIHTRENHNGLYAPTLNEQISILRRMNRAKDAPRIAALEALLR